MPGKRSKQSFPSALSNVETLIARNLPGLVIQSVQAGVN